MAKTVKAVGEVHGVGRPDHHDRNEEQKWDERHQIEVRRTQETFQHQAWGEVFEKWNDQVGLVLPCGTQPDQRQANAKAQAELQSELHPSCQTQASPLDDLDIVIRETDGAKSDDGNQKNPGVGVGQIGPKESGQDRADDNENAAHRRRAGFHLMVRWPFLPNLLANLEKPQSMDQPWPHDQPQCQGGQTRVGSAECDVLKNVQHRVTRIAAIQPFKQQVIEHSASFSATAVQSCIVELAIQFQTHLSLVNGHRSLAIARRANQSRRMCPVQRKTDNE